MKYDDEVAEDKARIEHFRQLSIEYAAEQRRKYDLREQGVNPNTLEPMSEEEKETWQSAKRIMQSLAKENAQRRAYAEKHRGAELNVGATIHVKKKRHLRRQLPQQYVDER